MLVISSTLANVENKLDQLSKLVSELRRWRTEISKALEHGAETHSFDDIVSGVLQGKYLFFPYKNHFYIMEQVNYPQFSVFHCFIAGGELGEVLAYIHEMKALGRELGCKYLSQAGRRGWESVLKATGWTHVCSTMYVPLEEENNVDGKRWGADAESRAS